MSSYEIIRKLWRRKKWIDNVDYFTATGGSPKLATRISELKKRGLPIITKMVKNKNTGKPHAKYALQDDLKKQWMAMPSW